MRHNKKDCFKGDCQDQEKIRDSDQMALKRTASTAVLFLLAAGLMTLENIRHPFISLQVRLLQFVS
jgi:hypothetical protein